MRALSLSIWILFATLGAGLAGDAASGPLRNRVDLNNAPKETIETLPGVGPKLAEQIILGRPYKTIAELDRVKGIGPKKLAQIRPMVFITPMTVAPALPSSATNQVARVNINSATQAELEKLPGIGPKTAEAIIKGRPFNRPEDLKKVAGFKGARFEKIKGQITVR